MEAYVKNPFLASSNDVSRPMPDELPVTIATFCSYTPFLVSHYMYSICRYAQASNRFSFSYTKYLAANCCYDDICIVLC